MGERGEEEKLGVGERVGDREERGEERMEGWGGCEPWGEAVRGGTDAGSACVAKWGLETILEELVSLSSQGSLLVRCVSLSFLLFLLIWLLVSTPSTLGGLRVVRERRSSSSVLRRVLSRGGSS